ncbi:MAG: endonuclease VII domain-containing protein [Dehalococcoidia bacterium]|jgi:hypothetical protein
MNKTCTKCGETKPLGCFSLKSIDNPNRGYLPECRECKRKRNSEYDARNRDKRIKYAREYHARNRDKLKEYGKKYWNAHREEQNKKARERWSERKKAYSETKKEWRENNPKKRMGYRLSHDYEMTLEDYNGLIFKQGGKCANKLCDQEHSDKTKLHVDHDHKTGLVRGLLCRNCNTALGMAKDNANRLLGLAAYLTDNILSDVGEVKEVAND